jgi:hypothetical protein
MDAKKQYIVSPDPDSGLIWRTSVKSIGADKVRRSPHPATQDNGKVRMGTMSPTFPLVRNKPANVTDSGRLRMGTLSPTFPPVRVR